jgi:hypothetical protein
MFVQSAIFFWSAADHQYETSSLSRINLSLSWIDMELIPVPELGTSCCNDHIHDLDRYAFEYSSYLLRLNRPALHSYLCSTKSSNKFAHIFTRVYTAYKTLSFTIPHQTQIRVITSATLMEILPFVCMDNSGILLLLHVRKRNPAYKLKVLLKSVAHQRPSRHNVPHTSTS